MRYRGSPIFASFRVLLWVKLLLPGLNWKPGWVKWNLKGNLRCDVYVSQEKESDDSLSTMQFIDFEYASWNYRGFDLGNHFTEYAGFECDYSRYPDGDHIAAFMQNYLAEGASKEPVRMPFNFRHHLVGLSAPAPDMPCIAAGNAGRSMQALMGQVGYMEAESNFLHILFSLGFVSQVVSNGQILHLGLPILACKQTCSFRMHTLHQMAPG